MDLPPSGHISCCRWRQATGTPVWGTPYGPYSNDKGRPVAADAVRAALATAMR
jgi:hypothetical protein